MKTPQFQIIARKNNWQQGFAVESAMANSICRLLNDADHDDHPNQWEVVTVPLNADEIRPTIASWEASGIS